MASASGRTLALLTGACLVLSMGSCSDEDTADLGGSSGGAGRAGARSDGGRSGSAGALPAANAGSESEGGSAPASGGSAGEAGTSEGGGSSSDAGTSAGGQTAAAGTSQRSGAAGEAGAAGTGGAGTGGEAGANSTETPVCPDGSPEGECMNDETCKDEGCCPCLHFCISGQWVTACPQCVIPDCPEEPPETGAVCDDCGPSLCSYPDCEAQVEARFTCETAGDGGEPTWQLQELTLDCDNP